MPFTRFTNLFKAAPIPPRCEFQVPHDRVALLVRNGVPMGLHPPGRHALPAGKVEVRLLLWDAWAEGGRRTSVLGLPFTRSLLYVEGDLVAVFIPAAMESHGLSAWEGIGTANSFQPLRPVRAPSRLRRFLGEACPLFPAPQMPARSR